MKQQPMARKLLALCLSLLLVLALSPTAWADPTEGGETPVPTETSAPTETAPAEEETTTTNETPEKTTTYVAQIGDKGYATLDEAFKSIQKGSNATITLLEDVSLESAITLDNGADVTLDLATHTVNGTISGNNPFFIVEGGSTLTVKNGTINSDGMVFRVHGDRNPSQGEPINSTLNLESSLNVKAAVNCVWIGGLGAEANIAATLSSSTNATIMGNGQSGQGGQAYNNGGTTINITEGAVITGPSDGFAMYLPQAGECTISGGTITAGTAIGIKSGTLNVEGGTITSTGEYVASPAANSDGISSTGSVISVDSNSAYSGGVEINISGGTLESQKGDAVREVGDADNLVSISISDDASLSTAAEERSDINIANDKPEDSKVSVTGGTFSKGVDDQYIDDSTLVAQVDDDGKYYVGGKAQEKIESATTSVKVENGTSVSKVPANVEVTNKTNDSITVNDEPVSKGESIKIPEPEQPSKPSTPSFTEPEYYPDYDEDVDYLPPVDEEEPEETEDLYMVTCRTLNVRLGGSTGYAKIGTLSRGTVVSGELENGWLKFAYDGGTAYCSADYLAKVDGDLTDMHVTCRTLNVRAGAGTNFEILGTLSRGTEVEILDVLNGWYKIEYLGGEAYVSAAYIG